MQELEKDNLLIICPNEQKIKILETLSKEKKLYNIKFMTKEEYKSNYYFSYDETALYYLMNKYNYNLAVAKVYLNNLYVIDIDKKYKSEKLIFLQNIKKELIDNNLLKFNPSFKEYIKTKNIIIKNYYDLDKYEEEMLKYKVEFPNTKLNTKVVECRTLEEEVNYICLKIIELLNEGIDINKIYLTNISNDYYYTINKLFNYYKIPINLDTKTSIYSTKVVKDYLNENILDIENKDKSKINRKLVNVLSSLSKLDSSTKEYKTILIDKLKNTNISTIKKTNAINIKDLYNQTFSNDEYVFVLGFNQDILPKMEKDIAFINDNIKEEVSLHTTNYLNKRNKQKVEYILSNIKNLYLSYKLSSPFNSYYKSSLITDLNLEIIKPNDDLYTNSNLYNKLRLAEKLDLYYLYGEKDNSLDKLLYNYEIPYKAYKNEFTGINNDLYLENLPYPLKLSYTSLNTYNECKFKYYIRNVLKLEPYQETFASFIGSMYHEILSLYRFPNFDFEKEYQKYIDQHELTLKEKLLLVKIKKDLKDLIETLKKQQLITGYDEAYYEKKAEVKLDKKVEVLFIGFIDKIMYYQKIEDTYFSIVDYKTGIIDTNIEPLKYGLHMQLPVYLYLIHYSKIFKNPIFTGIYYQNILYNYPTWSKNLEKEKQTKLYLQGYSTDDTSILERFDPTYEKSEYIKSMSYTEEKGFGTYSKIMNNDTLFELLKYTEKIINEKTDEIIESDFSINPKVYSGKNISCEYCPFKDLCYMKESDLIYLDKVEDLSFLGGDN